jgi:hypothetical protein
MNVLAMIHSLAMIPAGTGPALAVFVGFGLLPCCFLSLGGLISLAATVFWIWCIIDVVTKEPSEEGNKVIWVLVVVLLHLLGALIYFLVRRPERIRRYGQ